jgi:hypothetical protein
VDRSKPHERPSPSFTQRCNATITCNYDGVNKHETKIGEQTICLAFGGLGLRAGSEAEVRGQH